MHLAHLMVAGVALALTGCEPLPSGTGDHTREPGAVPGTPPGSKAGTEKTGAAPPTGTVEGGAACVVMADPLAASPRPVDRLVAVVYGTSEHPEIRGEVQFSASGDTVTVTSDVSGLPAGTHAHHVHIYGDCSDPAKGSAGSHFDFERLATTGGAAPPGGAATGRTASPVTGDLGNLQATGSAPATAERTLQGLNLAGTTSILGRAVVIHAGPNDPSKGPDGGAGTPIACGVIGIAPEEGAASGTPTSTTPSRETPPKR